MTPKVKRFNYTYHPGTLDRFDPTIIKGERIKVGAKVRLAREFNPPMFATKVFCMVEDEAGNVQSVYRMAVVKIMEGE